MILSLQNRIPVFVLLNHSTSYPEQFYTDADTVSSYLLKNGNYSLMRRSHLPSSHLWQLFPDLKQVLQNVRTQLKLFTNVRNRIWGVLYIFLVGLQEDQKSDVFQTFWVVNFFGTLSDSNWDQTKINPMEKLSMNRWNTGYPLLPHAGQSYATRFSIHL